MSSNGLSNVDPKGRGNLAEIDARARGTLIDNPASASLSGSFPERAESRFWPSGRNEVFQGNTVEWSPGDRCLFDDISHPQLRLIDRREKTVPISVLNRIRGQRSL